MYLCVCWFIYVGFDCCLCSLDGFVWLQIVGLRVDCIGLVCIVVGFECYAFGLGCWLLWILAVRCWGYLVCVYVA